MEEKIPNEDLGSSANFDDLSGIGEKKKKKKHNK
jgi:hypothetical protein